MRVHQIVPAVSSGDATSNHILEIDARLKKWGYETHIYAQHPSVKSKYRVQPYADLEKYLDNKDDLFIYHYGIYHYSMDFFRAALGRTLLIYHNITPSHFYHGWDKIKMRLCQVGRLALSSLSECDLALGDSEFNRRELIAAGFDEDKTAVLPIFLTLEQFEALPIDAKVKKNLKQSDIVNWLVVGRVVPNKAVEEVIRTFYVYNQHINPNSRLNIVGSNNMLPYKNALMELVTELGLQEQVKFSGRVSQAAFKTYYECADLYLTASHHEGFCVPLIESMYFDVPILAHDAAAIPETLGDAGILFGELGYAEVAQMAHIMISDTAVRQQIIKKQQGRLQFFAPDHVEALLQDVLQKMGLPNGRNTG